MRKEKGARQGREGTSVPLLMLYTNTECSVHLIAIIIYVLTVIGQSKIG